MPENQIELSMLRRMQAANIPEASREYRFHPIRRWQFDFAWPAMKLALEIDGGIYTRGRHAGASGFEQDCEKLNGAAILGWRVLRVTSDMVKDGRAIETLKQAMLYYRDNLK